MTEKLTAMEAFFAATNRLASLTSDKPYEPISRARGRPSEFSSRLWNIKIYSDSRDADLVAAAEAVKEDLRDKLTADGEALRRIELGAIADQIEALRSALPSMAAKAVIEMGVLARELKEESRR